MAGDISNVWQYIDPRIYPDPYCTPCQISSMNKNDISKNTLKQSTPFKEGFMDMMPAASPNVLTG